MELPKAFTLENITDDAILDLAYFIAWFFTTDMNSAIAMRRVEREKFVHCINAVDGYGSRDLIVSAFRKNNWTPGNTRHHSHRDELDTQLMFDQMALEVRMARRERA